MGSKEKLLQKVLSGSRNVRFGDINIFYSEEDGGYIADIPDLAFCSAFGETPDKALSQVEIAKEAWLKAAKAEGKHIPSPHYRPAIYQLTPA